MGNIPEDESSSGNGNVDMGKNEKPKDIMSSLSELVDDVNADKNLRFDESEKDIVLKQAIVVKIQDEEEKTMGDDDIDDNFDFEALDHEQEVDYRTKGKADVAVANGTYHDWDDTPLASTLYPSKQEIKSGNNDEITSVVAHEQETE